MKKVLFYIALIGIAIACWLGAGSILTLIFHGVDNFSYAVGSWCGRPFVMLLALGLALLFRKPIYRMTFKEPKNFKSNTAFCIIGAAIMWGFWMIIIQYFFLCA